MGLKIKVDDVSVIYKVGDFKDIGLKGWVIQHIKGVYKVDYFYAIKNVSFEVFDGDMLGIIGANGAGKSTILKAISGVMRPRKGSIQVYGNVSSLLELASGFDPELTVKENIYLRGAMLGYSEIYLNNRYADILSFAELESFEDRPFRQLSTGMQSRLAFSIASFVEPDILILDEVLSVGDGAFQEKSSKKMRELIDEGSVTVLVSHSLSQIREMCTKVLWLDHGNQMGFGDCNEICDQYEQFLQGK